MMNIKQIFWYLSEVIFALFLLLIGIMLLGLSSKAIADMARNRPYDYAAITTFLTVLLVAVTGLYTYATFLMAREMKRSREKQEESNIQISLEPDLRWANNFNLVIENLGSMPVYDLS